jgi:hypothetical protein
MRPGGQEFIFGGIPTESMFLGGIRAFIEKQLEIQRTLDDIMQDAYGPTALQMIKDRDEAIKAQAEKEKEIRLEVGEAAAAMAQKDQELIDAFITKQAEKTAAIYNLRYFEEQASREALAAKKRDEKESTQTEIEEGKKRAIEKDKEATEDAKTLEELRLIRKQNIKEFIISESIAALKILDTEKSLYLELSNLDKRRIERIKAIQRSEVESERDKAILIAQIEQESVDERLRIRQRLQEQQRADLRLIFSMLIGAGIGTAVPGVGTLAGAQYGAQFGPPILRTLGFDDPINDRFAFNLGRRSARDIAVNFRKGFETQAMFGIQNAQTPIVINLDGKQLTQKILSHADKIAIRGEAY